MSDQSPADESKRVPKDCNHCIHLEYFENESYEIQNGGYCCNKREYSTAAIERRHLNQLKSELYRTRAKKCHDTKICFLDWSTPP